VTIDRFTGDPQSVVVDGQEFTIITEVFISPYLFGRGTRVYVVRDRHGLFHILKDSWILSTHPDSEIQHIKAISDAVQAADLSTRLQILCPRFVAGEDSVDNTEEARDLAAGMAPARIRRRIITGPIGDPITSFRSRVECLQALLDIVDQLKFLNENCGLVHGDVSMNNIVIVRFLPNILAASPAFSLPAAATQPLSQAVAIRPCTMNGLPFDVSSGGSIIDFDYTRAKNVLTTKTSGTMPYMAVDLMNPAKPVAHRLIHDIESICYILLHLVRFTTGPAGTGDGKIANSHRVAVWHHEHNTEIIKDLKNGDIVAIIEEPNQYITNYWAPITSHVIKLLK
ncbi:hypothetical protein BDN70DRAFT_789678, partial [Pholiota conissans]